MNKISTKNKQETTRVNVKEGSYDNLFNFVNENLIVAFSQGYTYFKVYIACT